MASQPDVLQSCFQEAAKAARPALEHCIDAAVAALQDAELKSMKVAERDELAQAWRQLQEHKAAWGARYQVSLLEAFDKGAKAAAEAARIQHLPVSDVAAGYSTSRPAALGMDSFSLVADADVAQAIESSRLLQQILPRVEQVLAELDSLISSAQGLANVRPELNPLRPETFTRLLQDLMTGHAADAALVPAWIKQLAEPLAREIRKIYERLVQMLELAHVHAAQYRVLQTPTSVSARQQPGKGGAGGSAGASGNGQAAGGGNAGNGSTEAGTSPPQYADLSNYEIRHELFQDFLFHGGSNAQASLAPSYYASVEKELTALQAAPDSAATPLAEYGRVEDSGYRAAAAVDRPKRFVDVTSPLSPQVWGNYGRSRERAIVRTQLKKEAKKVGQVLGLEVVRKLVNQVAQDPRLLVPVREAIVALEPSLLRLAMVDPRFFSDERHAGRRLMERVAQRSFKYNDEYSHEFTVFFEAISRTFNELNALAIESVQPFGAALAGLEHIWDEQDQLEFEGRHKVLKALHFAEERQERADQIAFDLSSRSDLDNVPGVVLDFLFGPWSLAMAHAKLADQRNQVDPEGFGSVVPDLLWSVKRDVTLKRPAKLIKMIPGLLEKLHTGLDMLGQAPKENEQFFESLMKLHQPVLKLRRLKTQRDAQESGSAALEPEELPATPEQRRAKAAEQPWLGREELDAAGFEDTLPSEPAELTAMEESASMPVADASLGAVAHQSQEVEAAELHALASTAAEAASQPADKTAENGDTTPPPLTSAEAETILFSLRTGNWVDLYSKHRWLRAQLIWASTKATLFMFLSHGGQPHSMTKRSCEKLIMQRWLRPVDSHAVVAQALDAVTAQASASVNTQRKTGGHQDFSPSSAPQNEFETV